MRKNEGKGDGLRSLLGFFLNPTMHTKLWDGPKHWFKTGGGLTWCSWKSISFHFGGNPVALTSFVHSNMRVSGYSSPLIPQARVLTQRGGELRRLGPDVPSENVPQKAADRTLSLLLPPPPPPKKNRNRRYLPGDRSSGQAGCLSGRIF